LIEEKDWGNTGCHQHLNGVLSGTLERILIHYAFFEVLTNNFQLLETIL
jgi:hypothetical protein